MRAAIYCQVSSASQEENSSLQTQENRCLAYAAERKWIVTAVFREVHTGAVLFERPQLARLREEVRNGRVNVVLSYALDRLSRKQTHVAIIAEEFEHGGANLAFVTEDFEDGPVGTFIRGAKAFAAELEREKIRERTQRGLRARVTNGKPAGTAPAPFGLCWRDAAKSGYEINPNTINTLRRIYADYDGGMSLRRLAATLNEDGVLPPRHFLTGSTTWGVSTVRHILTEKAYTGVGHALRYQTSKVSEGRLRTTLRPDNERVSLPAGTYPVVIDANLFERVQAQMSVNRRESMRTDRNPEIGILRRGYVTCGGCGTRLVVMYERGVPVYRCHVQNRQRHNCPGASIRVELLDAAVWARVETILTDPSILAKEVERLRRSDPTESDLEMINRQLVSTSRQQKSVAQGIAMLDGNLEALAPLVAQLDILGKQRQTLERECAQIEVRRKIWMATQDRLTHSMNYCELIASSLQALTFVERRTALEALGVNVRVFRADCNPRWIATLSLPYADEGCPESSDEDESCGNVFSSGGTIATSCATTGSRTAITSSNSPSCSS